MVEGIWNIHVALSSNLILNPDKFHSYCQNIKKIYDDSVGSWSELNTTIHKVLDHAYLVLKILPRGLAIGQLNEEAPGKQIVYLFEKYNFLTSVNLHRQRHNVTYG